MGIATGHSAAFVDLNWSPAHISVSNFGFSSKFHYRCGVLSCGQFMGLVTIFCLSFYFAWEFIIWSISEH